MWQLSHWSVAIMWVVGFAVARTVVPTPWHDAQVLTSSAAPAASPFCVWWQVSHFVPSFLSIAAIASMATPLRP